MNTQELILVEDDPVEIKIDDQIVYVEIVNETGQMIRGD